jgi:hypothetical protein
MLYCLSSGSSRVMRAGPCCRPLASALLANAAAVVLQSMLAGLQAALPWFRWRMCVLHAGLQVPGATLKAAT